MNLHDLSLIIQGNRDWLGQLAVGLISILTSAVVADVRAKRTLRKAANRKATRYLSGLIDNPQRLVQRGMDTAELIECAELASFRSRERLRAAIARCEAAAHAKQPDELGQPLLARPEEARTALRALLKELQ